MRSILIRDTNVSDGFDSKIRNKLGCGKNLPFYQIAEKGFKISEDINWRLNDVSRMLRGKGIL